MGSGFDVSVFDLEGHVAEDLRPLGLRADQPPAVVEVRRSLEDVAAGENRVGGLKEFEMGAASSADHGGRRIGPARFEIIGQDYAECAYVRGLDPHGQGFVLRDNYSGDLKVNRNRGPLPWGGLHPWAGTIKG